MSRYNGPRLKIVRRLGKLPGLTQKMLSTKVLSSPYSENKKKLSQYAIRLKEKQKLRFNYGLTESQLIKYVKAARKTKSATGEILLQLLEMRLDNIVFKLGLTPTIASARQLITHGHILVNNKKVTIASYQCQPQEQIAISNKKSSRNLIKTLLDKSSEIALPQHLKFDKENQVGQINDIANRESVNLQLNELLIVEYYSRQV